MADQAGAPSKTEEKKPEDAVEDVPDPDEDDLDDLDGEPIVATLHPTLPTQRG